MLSRYGLVRLFKLLHASIELSFDPLELVGQQILLQRRIPLLLFQLFVLNRQCLVRAAELLRLVALGGQVLLKLADLVSDFFLVLCLEAWQRRLTEAWLAQVHYHGRYERRVRRHFPGILMKLT